jgi:hypothetical protein
MHILRYNGDVKSLLWCTGPYIYAEKVLPRAARVLEVGGGQDPHPGADVIVEKYLEDNSQRMGGYEAIFKGRLGLFSPSGEIVGDGGEFAPTIVQADVEDMPFEYKSFDFVICKDVLEHTGDPVKAAAEMSRVGKAGFCDCPKLFSEFLWPQPGMHRWTFDYDGTGGLIGRAIEFTSPFGTILHEAFDKSVELQTAWAASRFFFHAIVFWEDELRVSIGEPIKG